MPDNSEKIERLIRSFNSFRHYIMINHRTQNLKPGEMGVIKCLMHNTNEDVPELKPSQISSLMGLQQPTITPVLRSLEENGYVMRRNSTVDRRIVYISLTKLAYETIGREHSKTYQLFEGLVEHLGREDSDKLAELMERTADYLRERKSSDNLED